MKAKGMKDITAITSKVKGAYLTKRVLGRAANEAIRKASKEAMLNMGYVVYVEKGQVIQMSHDGTKNVLEKLPRIERPSKIVFE